MQSELEHANMPQHEKSSMLQKTTISELKYRRGFIMSKSFLVFFKSILVFSMIIYEHVWRLGKKRYMENLLTNVNGKNKETKRSKKVLYNLKAEKLIRAANDNFVYFKDYEMALIQINEVLKLDPENTKAYILRGTIHFCLDELSTALECFNKALEINPYSVEALSLKANVLDIMGSLPEALDSCDKAFFNVTENNLDYLTSLFDQKLAILIKLKKYREARETLKQCYEYLKEDDSEYIASCYRDVIDSLHKKRQKKRELAEQQRLRLVYTS